MVLPQFWLPRRGSTSSNMGVGFVLLFVVIFSASSSHSSPSFLRFILDDPLSASHSRRPSLCIKTFSPHRRGESEWITRSRSPKHRRGESEWISLRLVDSPTFLSTSRSACFGDLHVSTSAHHDVYTGGNLLCIMQHFQAQTSTYASISAASFSALHSSFRYLRS